MDWTDGRLANCVINYNTLLLPHSRFFSFGAVSKDGPSKEMAEGTNFEMTLLGKGWKQEGKAVGKPDRCKLHSWFSLNFCTS